MHQKFLNFVNESRNANYKTDINLNIPIDKQHLLEETEGILSLIYRNYWATDEEKKQFIEKDKQEQFEIENKKKQQYSVDIFKNSNSEENINESSSNKSLIIIKENNFITKIFKKIINMFKK